MLTFSRMLAVSIAVSCFLNALPALAKSDDDLKALQKEVQAIREGQAQMQKDLVEIKKLLQQGTRAAPARGQQAFEPTDVQLGDVAYRGPYDAPVTLIEFTDYQCPYCKRHATTVMPPLFKSYGDTGKVRFILREFPIVTLHPRAIAASEAALCAGDQDQYWGMHDALFNDQKANSDENFQQQAAALGLDVSVFAECMNSDKHTEQIKADVAEGRKLGVSGTPSFVVGLTDPEDPSKVHLTKFIRGAQPLPTFSAAIDELIKTASINKAPATKP